MLTDYSTKEIEFVSEANLDLDCRNSTLFANIRKRYIILIKVLVLNLIYYHHKKFVNSDMVIEIDFINHIFNGREIVADCVGKTLLFEDYFIKYFES